MSRIFTSPHPDVHIPKTSIFTHVFSRDHDPRRTAYIDTSTGKTLSRSDVHSQSLELAWSLRNILNQPQGATIAVFSPNSLWWPIIVLGGIAAGLRVTTINSAYTPSELIHNLKDSGAYLIFTHPSLLKTAQEALKMLGVSNAEASNRIILAGSSSPNSYKGVEQWKRVEQLLKKGRLEKEISFDGEAAHETAAICYSSGTTSLPKGVELTHHNVVTIPCIVEDTLWRLKEPDAVILGVLPFYHIYGLVMLILVPMFLGTPQVIMSQFDPEEFCANIERYKVSVALVVPPILVVLASHPAPEKYDLRSLRIIISGAAPLGVDLILRVSERLAKLGVHPVISQGCGQTETSPVTHALEEGDWKTKAGCIGQMLPNVQGRIVLDDGVTDARDGEPGEIWIRGPNVMKGYLNNPEATKSSITPDGWFMTGDIAIVDAQGCFKIIDRKKELIKYKGFQVPPAELENLLLTHPNIIDAGVTGVWMEAEATEYPRAYVVPRGGAQSLKTQSERGIYGREIQKWVQQRVARHKCLRGGVIVIDAIPKSASGKILRRELRELHKSNPVGRVAKL